MADELVCVEREDELPVALDTQDPITILGEGTNVILRERIRGRVVRLFTKDISFKRRGDDSCLVDVAAGVHWHELVRHCLGQGFAGLENLALIPGSVGAAPIQNIGAYGVELADLIESVRVFDRRNQKFDCLTPSECDFSYRDSKFKSAESGNYVVLGISLALGRFHPKTRYKDVATALATRRYQNTTPTLLAETICQIRRRKLPDQRFFPNVGSVFKNPVVERDFATEIKASIGCPTNDFKGQTKLSAAYLIDHAGWRGYTNDEVSVWPRQALVFVNHGSSNALPFLDLAERVKNDVFAKFDVELELEPTVLGTD